MDMAIGFLYGCLVSPIDITIDTVWCYIFTLSQITKANGCYVTNVLANRYTAINADKIYKQMICLPTNIARVYE